MTIYFTKLGGRRQFENELDRLKKELNDVKSAYVTNDEKEGNSWNSNTVRDQSEQMLNAIRTRIAQIENLLHSSHEINIINRNSEQVAIGSIVEFIDLTSSDLRVVEIVGYGETKGDKLLGYNTPLAQVMISKQAGEIVTLEVGKIEKSFQITQLYSDWPENT